MAGRSLTREAVPRKRVSSPTAQRVDDFDPVVCEQLRRVVCPARDDLAIDLDCDPALGQAGFDQQLCNAAVFAERMAGAIEQDFHGAIVAFQSARCITRECSCADGPGQSCTHCT